MGIWGAEGAMNMRMSEWEGALVKDCLLLRDRDVAKLRLSFIPAAEAATHERRHQRPAGID